MGEMAERTEGFPSIQPNSLLSPKTARFPTQESLLYRSGTRRAAPSRDALSVVHLLPHPGFQVGFRAVVRVERGPVCLGFGSGELDGSSTTASQAQVRLNRYYRP
jgi:hypothetical protein